MEVQVLSWAQAKIRESGFLICDQEECDLRHIREDLRRAAMFV
jgi:hypothetical protein